MALAEREVPESEEEVNEITELLSLIRSVTKEALILFLKIKYGLDLKKTTKLTELHTLVATYSDNEYIIQSLVEISDCIKEINHETFAELCDNYGVKDIIYNEDIRLTVVRCYLEVDIELFRRIKVVAAVNKDKNFEVLAGKVISNQITFIEEHKQEISEVIAGLIEKGRNYIINTELVKNDIIMTAHFEQRKKTFTTISKGKQISSVTVIPTTKAVAKYNIESNRIQLKCGRNKRIRESIINTFGVVFFKDNTHFSDEEQQRVYRLDKVKDAEFDVSIDDELAVELESAQVVEETLRVPFDDGWAVLTLKSKDVEFLLKELSNEKYDLKSMERIEVTIELKLKPKKEGEKSKLIKVTISDTSKIDCDPQYTKLINKCLFKWGIHIGI
ncbi:hypothetical protein [Cohnella abietis]|uniref:Uncharacterized protein n=1 Tax=Cohnella abietis TaxID=2507935 RepID=A0A3T1CZG0_9BACL|nr:hypothetical protein [Cohnella abietis]BBI31145.1 hypothetical protein KCTCHS21_05440 [Cohnella abietis]